MNHVNKLRRDGFAILDCFVNHETIDLLLADFARLRIGDTESQRAGKPFGIRNLLNVVPSIRVLANSPPFREIVESVLGPGARVVRGIYFDKHRDANWKVVWHQDLTIAVRERVDVDDYGPWSIKAGIHHLQPPVSILEEMLTLRLHLDDTDETNGALRALPGSHSYGRLSASDIQDMKLKQPPVTCAVKKGGLLLMRPLLVHSSLAATNPHHRRVLHLEYSAIELPGGLQWFEE